MTIARIARSFPPAIAALFSECSTTAPKKGGRTAAGISPGSLASVSDCSAVPVALREITVTGVQKP
jgi:hypothetical protein